MFEEQAQYIVEALHGIGLCALWWEDVPSGRQDRLPYIYLKYAWVDWRMEVRCQEGTWLIEVHKDRTPVEVIPVASFEVLLNTIITELRSRYAGSCAG